MILAICIICGICLLVMSLLSYTIIYLHKENEKLYETILRIENPPAVGALKASKAEVQEDKPSRPKPISR